MMQNMLYAVNDSMAVNVRSRLLTESKCVTELLSTSK